MTDWDETTLGDLFDPIKERVQPSTVPGTRFVGMEHMVTGEPRVKQWGRAEDVTSSAPVFRSGDVLFGRLRPYLRKVALADFNGICSGEVLVWRPRRDRVLPEFLQFLASSEPVIAAAVDKSAGSRMPRVSSDDLAETLVLLPPLPEQSRIVAIVGSIDAQIDLLREEATSLHALYDGHLGSLWIDADGSAAEPRALGELMALDVTRVPLCDSEEYRLAGVLNAGQGLVDKGTFTGADTDYKAMNLLSVNQVVMRKLTAWEGPIAVVGDDFDGFLASNEFPTFTLKGMAPEYFNHVCRTARLRHEMKQRVTGSVQRRKRLNPDQLLLVELPIPGVDAQRAVAAELESIRVSAAALEGEAARLSLLRGGLLRNLLSRHVILDESVDILLNGQAA